MPDRPDHALSRWAALRCADAEFRRWASLRCGWLIDTTEAAADWMREVCEVASRAEFDTDPAAAERFHTRVREPYALHLKATGAST